MVDGGTYSGDWLDGFADGVGTRIYADGSAYEGQYEQNQRSGHGMEWDDKGDRTHCGIYENSNHSKSCPVPRSALPVDSQKLTAYEKSASLLYPNGDYYVGSLNAANEPHCGDGHLFSSSNQLIYSGKWMNGKQLNDTNSSSPAAASSSSSPSLFSPMDNMHMKSKTAASSTAALKVVPVAASAASDASSSSSSSSSSSTRFCDIDSDLENFSPLVGLKDQPLLSLTECIAALPAALQQQLKPFVIGSNAFGKMKAKTDQYLVNADMIASIHLYTQESQLYRQLNSLLRERDRSKLKPFSPYLKLFLNCPE